MIFRLMSNKNNNKLNNRKSISGESSSSSSGLTAHLAQTSLTFNVINNYNTNTNDNAELSDKIDTMKNETMKDNNNPSNQNKNRNKNNQNKQNQQNNQNNQNNQKQNINNNNNKKKKNNNNQNNRNKNSNNSQSIFNTNGKTLSQLKDTFLSNIKAYIHKNKITFTIIAIPCILIIIYLAIRSYRSYFSPQDESPNQPVYLANTSSEIDAPQITPKNITHSILYNCSTPLDQNNRMQLHTIFETLFHVTLNSSTLNRDLIIFLGPAESGKSEIINSLLGIPMAEDQKTGLLHPVRKKNKERNNNTHTSDDENLFYIPQLHYSSRLKANLMEIGYPSERIECTESTVKDAVSALVLERVVRSAASVRVVLVCGCEELRVRLFHRVGAALAHLLPSPHTPVHVLLTRCRPASDTHARSFYTASSDEERWNRSTEIAQAHMDALVKECRVRMSTDSTHSAHECAYAALLNSAYNNRHYGAIDAQNLFAVNKTVEALHELNRADVEDIHTELLQQSRRSFDCLFVAELRSFAVHLERQIFSMHTQQSIHTHMEELTHTLNMHRANLQQTYAEINTTALIHIYDTHYNETLDSLNNRLTQAESERNNYNKKLKDLLNQPEADLKTYTLIQHHHPFYNEYCTEYPAMFVFDDVPTKYTSWNTNRTFTRKNIKVNNTFIFNGCFEDSTMASTIIFIVCFILLVVSIILRIACRISYHNWLEQSEQRKKLLRWIIPVSFLVVLSIGISAFCFGIMKDIGVSLTFYSRPEFTNATKVTDLRTRIANATEIITHLEEKKKKFIEATERNLAEKIAWNITQLDLQLQMLQLINVHTRDEIQQWEQHFTNCTNTSSPFSSTRHTAIAYDTIIREFYAQSDAAEITQFNDYYSQLAQMDAVPSVRNHTTQPPQNMTLNTIITEFNRLFYT